MQLSRESTMNRERVNLGYRRYVIRSAWPCLRKPRFLLLSVALHLPSFVVDLHCFTLSFIRVHSLIHRCHQIIGTPQSLHHQIQHRPPLSLDKVADQTPCSSSFPPSPPARSAAEPKAAVALHHPSLHLKVERAVALSRIVLPFPHLRSQRQLLHLPLSVLPSSCYPDQP